MLVPQKYFLVALVVSVILVLAALTVSSVRFWLATQAVPIGSTFTVTSTGYASSPYQTDATPCFTAAGTVVRQGVVAANFLPFGTLIRLSDKDYKNRTFIVEDRTNGRYRTRLDIWFPSTKDALQHGIRTLDVTVVGYGIPGQELTMSKPAMSDAEEGLAASPTLFERASLEVFAVTRFLSQYLGTNVNQHDVDCSLIVGEALGEAAAEK